MHEMSITQALLELVLTHAGGQHVTDVYLRVGAMSSVVPDSVSLFFEYLSQNTLAEGARLHFDFPPSRLVCAVCKDETLVAPGQEQRQAAVVRALAAGCSTCGEKQLRIVEGIEFDLVSLSVLSGSDAPEA